MKGIEKNNVINERGNNDYLFRALFENSINAIMLGTTNGVILEANNLALDMFGYTLEELRKLGYVNIFDHLDDEIPEHLKMLEPEGKARGVLIGIRKNGERFPCEFFSNIFTNEIKEKITSTVLVDITDRRKAEEEVALLLENTEERFVFLNQQLRIVSFSKQFKETYERLFCTIVANDLSILDLVPDDIRESRRIFYQKILNGEVIEEEILHTGKDGEEFIFYTLYKPVFNATGKIIGLFVTIKNITEKVKTNLQREIERKDKEALINSTDDLIWSIDKKFRLMAGNTAFLNLMHKYSNCLLKRGDELLTADVFSQDFISFWKTLYLRALTGESFKQELYAPAGDNLSPVWYETNLNAIFNGAEIVGVACFGRNISEKKLAQLKLKENSELLEKLTYKIPAAIFQFEISADGQMKFPYISGGVKIINPHIDIESIKKDATLGFKTVYPDDLNKLFLSIEFSKANLSHWELQYRTVKSDGKIAWLKGSASPEKKEDGTVVWYGYIQDITEEKKKNEEIKIAKERYDLLAKATNDTIWDWDITANTIEWNKGIFEIFGYSEENLQLGMDWWYGKIHPKDVDRVRENIEFRVNSCASVWKDEYRFRCADGSYKHVYDRGFLVVSDNVPLRMIGAMQDISAKKQEEHRLKLLESVITNTNDSIMITEAQRLDEPGPKILYVNDAFTQMTGYTAEEVIGKTPRILQGPKSDKKELKRLSDAIRKWEPCEATIINYKKNGEQFWINFSLTPVANDKGWFTHWVSVERDVTEVKFNEFEREQMVSELLQNNKDLKQFSYVTSHNLRAPIANLLGLTNLIDHYKIDDASLKQILDGIKQSALMFDETVKDLSKVLIIKDQTNPLKEPVSLEFIINKTLKQLGVNIKDKDIDINCDFVNVPYVVFTSSYLESVFMNLFTNAIKYKSHQRKLKIDITSKHTKDYNVVTFTDNGIGIDLEKYGEKIFHLYQRFHENADGKGLGLYLVKSQLEALGSTIAVESKVGSGTTFILKFGKET